MATTQQTSKLLPNLQGHALIGESPKIPINDATLIISMSPVVLPAPDRIMDLHLRVSSLNGYSPIANVWAAHGFAVIQPTHLSSRALSLSPEDYLEAPWFLRSRVIDFKLILDKLDEIETIFLKSRDFLMTVVLRWLVILGVVTPQADFWEPEETIRLNYHLKTCPSHASRLGFCSLVLETVEAETDWFLLQ